MEVHHIPMVNKVVEIQCNHDFKTRDQDKWITNHREVLEKSIQMEVWKYLRKTIQGKTMMVTTQGL